MKKYQKPKLEVIQLKVQENIAKTTIYEDMVLGSYSFDNTEIVGEASGGTGA